MLKILISTLISKFIYKFANHWRKFHGIEVEYNLPSDYPKAGILSILRPWTKLLVNSINNNNLKNIKLMNKLILIF